MKWRGRRGSSNIDDRRGARRGGGVRVGGLGVVAIIVLGMIFGVDPSFLLGMVGGGVSAPPVSQGPNKIDDDAEKFVSVVLADTEDVWGAVFPQEFDRPYAPPVLVLFSGHTQSGCGGASAATGPFYCPADRSVYLDTEFFALLKERLGAGGDFAQAYVIAHEVGHHVQNELGILPKVNRLRADASQTGANELSVRLELQADCLSGVWAREADQRFSSVETGDIEEALNAASKIGDDVLQKRSQGYVTPDSFTHGTAEQRMRWFTAGFKDGDIAACDTFSAAAL